MSLRTQHVDATRRAILQALGEQIAESGTMGFSIQDVAARAGVTHRTVYNHFPTREDLNNAFAVHVEEELLGGGDAKNPDEDLGLDELPALFERLFPVFAAHEASLRAYAMLMVASRSPAKVASDRSRRFAALISERNGPMPEAQLPAIVAAIRMLASTTGWHLLTEHHGLSHVEAARTAAWATRVLLEAVARGDRPPMENPDETDHDR